MTLAADVDPKHLAEEYLRQKHVPQLFEVLGSQLLLHKPENPREFLLHELKRMREDPGRQDMTKSIFTEKDLETIFSMFDRTKRGELRRTDATQAFRHIGIQDDLSSEVTTLSLQEFNRIAKEKLRAMNVAI